MSQLYYGVCEARNDPMQLGRVKVRVIGLHTADKLVLPTDQLPWALLMQPATSAAMNGIGQAPVGLVPGTWVIVQFMDEDCQQPIILGSIGGVPDIKTVVSDVDENAIIIRDPITGQASEQIATTNASGVLIQTIGDTKVEPAKPTTYSGGGKSNTDVPKTVPPPQYTTNRGAMSAGIQAIIVACKLNGYTEKNAIAAILGIVGGECEWIPKNEGYIYSDPKTLVTLFSAFNKDIEVARTYAKGGARCNETEFFEKIYGSESEKGRKLGNREVGDGVKYKGRGFIQITGKNNYVNMAAVSGVDIVNNPDSLNSNLDNAAKVAVAFFKDGLKNKNIPQNDPNFFVAAARVVNGDHFIDKKRKLYEYFLGQDTGASEKSAAPEDIKVNDAPASDVGKSELPGGDRTSNIVLGFSDPQGKYPLRDHLHEPDTNRLARGVSKGTIAAKKTAQRTTGIPRPFVGDFSQPSTPFGAVYPYNKVFESESGHVMEFDDTPSQERVNIAHRTGTFTEIDANGTQTNKIVGDGFFILERNGCVYIRGECNLTTDGDINILCNSSANIEIMGNATVDVRADADISVNHNVRLGVGGDVSALVNGNVSAKIGGNALLDITGNMSTKVGGNYDLCVAGHFRLSANTSSITSVGNTALQGSQIHLNTAGIAQAGVCTPAPDSVQNIHIADKGKVIGADFPYMTLPPPDLAAEVDIGETPDEISEAGSEKMNSEIAGDKSTPANTASTDSAIALPNNTQIAPASCELIYVTESFQHSYVLSEKSNITIGTLLECPGNCSEPQNTHVSDSKGGSMYALSKQEIVCNMKQIAVNILEGVYAIADGRNGVIVTSSFRTPGVAASSNSSSDHNKGRAIDIQIRGKNSDVAAHFELINKLATVLPYDQLILEYRDPKAGTIGPRKVWIHISYRGSKNRKMAFTMLNDSTYKRDINGQPAGFYAL